MRTKHLTSLAWTSLLPCSVRSFSTANAAEPQNNNDNAFASSYHVPVLVKEILQALLPTERTSNLLLVDGTLGGGGHSQSILERLQPGDILFGCDVDPDALVAASERLSQYLEPSQDQPLFVPVLTNFCRIDSQLLRRELSKRRQLSEQETSTEIKVDGILLDLGVSSFQIDSPGRGFAYMKDGPLDMRMNANSGMTAADVCNVFDVDELKRILRTYGDEPRAKKVAESILQHRPLTTTADLRQAVAAVTPQRSKSRRLRLTPTLARVFQSLRIVVNQEDTVLEKALTEMAPNVLRKPGGKLAVLSYQSLEDRAVKRVMRDGMVNKKAAIYNNNQKDIYGNFIGIPKPFRVVSKALKASPEEVEANVRARSATLRVAERTDS